VSLQCLCGREMAILPRPSLQHARACGWARQGWRGLASPSTGHTLRPASGDVALMICAAPICSISSTRKRRTVPGDRTSPGMAAGLVGPSPPFRAAGWGHTSAQSLRALGASGQGVTKVSPNAKNPSF